MFFSKRMFASILLSLLIVVNTNMALACDGEFVETILDAASTPKGVVVIACTNAFLSGIFNFVWAFNWQAHANVTADVSVKIQEAGGLGAAGQCFLLGAGMTYLLYRHQKKRAAADTQENKAQDLEKVVVEGQS